MERRKSITALLSISAFCLLLCAAYLISGYSGRSSFTIEAQRGKGAEGSLTGKSEVSDAPGSTAEETGGESSEAPLLNINTATVSELSSLPGLDIAQAEKIVSYRTRYGDYLDVSELLHAGIRGEIVERISNLICV